ncbi:MAG: T9SS type A sorting domain-containing protein [Bacteroidales bacterium]|nr:T9SS type A sorting domain-containing protein [Bacteroidales bacterium]
MKNNRTFMKKVYNSYQIHYLVILLVVFLLSVEGYSQISQGGEPYSFSKQIDLPEFQQPNPTELQFRENDLTKDCSAMEFAKFLSLESSLQDPAWQIIQADDKSTIYRLAISSPGALAIGAYFSDFHIPIGAELFIYSPDHQQKIGAFTSLNNPSSGYFATEYLLGDELIIEYREPVGVHGKGHFVVKEILHAYRGFDQQENEKGFGGSGDCEVNVNCPEGDGKKNQRDAVLRLLIKNGNSGVWCTGSLVNNTSEDRTPYVITADHCGNQSSSSDQEQWVIYFHYQAWGCANPAGEPTHKTMVGCTEVASSSNAGILGSDFFLVQLLQDVPENYNPYFLGWNRDGLGSSNGYSIHHPQGDIKKVSTYTDALENASYSSGIPNGFWEVVWSETTSGHGVTEPGSSGSPIFDSEGYLVGTLTGGQESCSALTAPDYYGKFSKHWDQNGASDDEQLLPWLDPINSGIEKMSGIYLGIDEAEVLSNKLFEAVPNPVLNELTLYFHKNYNDYQVLICDLSGQVIDDFISHGNISKTLSVSHLQKGVYIIHVRSGNLHQTIKLAKL